MLSSTLLQKKQLQLFPPSVVRTSPFWLVVQVLLEISTNLLLLLYVIALLRSILSFQSHEETNALLQARVLQNGNAQRDYQPTRLVLAYQGEGWNSRSCGTHWNTCLGWLVQTCPYLFQFTWETNLCSSIQPFWFKLFFTHLIPLMVGKRGDFTLEMALPFPPCAS